MVLTKSVETRIEKQRDGLRILVTRFRGRGLPGNRYDIWMPNLGPSEKLLRDLQRGKVAWAEFKRRYRAELLQNAPIDRVNATIKNHGQKFTLRLLRHLAKSGHLTLLCHCAEDEQHCHRHLLRQMVSSKI